MIASGFLKRSIADQTGTFSFNLRIKLSNTSGNCNFGVSGLNVINYKMQSGKIYDNNNGLIGNYTKNIPVSISGNIGPRTHDLYLNGDAIFLGRPKATGKFTHFYINPLRTTATFTLGFVGTKPSYTYTTGTTFISGQPITGQFINSNPNIAFRILSGRITQSGNNISLSGHTSGDITNTGYFYLICNTFNQGQRMTVPLTFTTNFGTVSFNFVASGSRYKNIILYSNSGVIPSGTAEQLRISGFLIDGSRVNLSTISTYNSSNTGVIYLIGTGLASGTFTGTAIVSGAYDVHRYSQSITVQ